MNAAFDNAFSDSQPIAYRRRCSIWLNASATVETEIRRVAKTVTKFDKAVTKRLRAVLLQGASGESIDRYANRVG